MSRSETQGIIKNAFFDFCAASFKAMHDHVYPQNENPEFLPDTGKWCFDRKGAAEYMSVSEESIDRWRRLPEGDERRLDWFTVAIDNKPRFRREELDRLLNLKEMPNG